METHSLLQANLSVRVTLSNLQVNGSVFLKVFRKRSNYRSRIQKKTDQAKPLANFTFLRIHHAEENLRKYVLN